MKLANGKNGVSVIFACLLMLTLTQAYGAGQPEAPVEATHVVTLKQAHQGNLEIDTLLLDSYERQPEELREFYLSSRKFLALNPEAMLSDPEILANAKKAGLSLMSGPMLGDVTSDGITIWLRAATNDPLEIEVETASLRGKKSFSVNRGNAGKVCRIRLNDLQSNTLYNYHIVKEGLEKRIAEGSFVTAPEGDAGERLRIAFGSCYHKIGLHNPNLMRLIAERGNRAMLLLGDLAVDDRESNSHKHCSDYLLRDVSKPWREFVAKVPVFASWDDHDYLNNDKSGLQKNQITNAQRNELRKVWQEHWNNPQTTVEDRGIYFHTVIGDVEIIMLDTRSCRTWAERGQRGSYLGDAQMQWLKKTLQASTAKFILLSSGTMWSDYMSRAKDSWGTWDIPGREEIFDFIEANNIGGVLLLSGDRHGARGFKIERPSGFTLHEFEAATLGGVPGPEGFAPEQYKDFQTFGYAGGLKAFGEFTFEMNQRDPEVTFRLIDEAGRELEMFRFKRSELLP